MIRNMSLQIKSEPNTGAGAATHDTSSSRSQSSQSQSLPLPNPISLETSIKYDSEDVFPDENVYTISSSTSRSSSVRDFKEEGEGESDTNENDSDIDDICPDSNWTRFQREERLRMERKTRFYPFPDDMCLPPRRSRRRIQFDPPVLRGNGEISAAAFQREQDDGEEEQEGSSDEVIKATSLPQWILNRELGAGLPNGRGSQLAQMNEMYMFRGMIKTRCTAVDKRDTPRKVSFKEKKTLKLENGWMQHDLEGAKQLCLFTWDKLIIKDTVNNTRKMFTLNPYLSKHPFKFEYTLQDNTKDKLKWRSFDAWSPTPNVLATDAEGKVIKVPATFFVLESKKLLLFDFSTGKKIDEVDLSLDFPQGPTHYSDIVVDEEAERIYIQANAQAVKQAYPGNPHHFADILVLQYPPIKFLYRVVFPIGCMGPGVTSVELSERLLVVFKGTSAELLDFEEVIQLNIVPTDDNDVDVKIDPRHPHLQTISVINKPPVLQSIKTIGQFLSLVPHISPPHVIVKTKVEYQVFNMENMKNPVYRFPSTTGEDYVFIGYYDLLSPRIHITGLLHGLDVVEMKWPNSTDSEAPPHRTVFTTKDYKCEELSPTRTATVTQPQPAIQRSRRQIAKKVYCDMEKPRQFGMGYDITLGLIALCTVEDGTLYTTIYENRTLTKWMSLPPVKLAVSKKYKDLCCSDILVHFNDWLFSVKLKLYDNNGAASETYEVYTMNLLSQSQSDNLL